jgi:hypothetical protein
VSGNVSVGNLTTAGNVTGGYIKGNGSQLTSIVTSIVAGSGISVSAATGAVTVTATASGNANTIVNGTSNVSISSANGPVRIYANAFTGASAYFDDGTSSGGNINFTPGSGGYMNLNLVKILGGQVTGVTSLDASAKITAVGTSQTAPFNGTPATKTGTSTGTIGDISWDANYIYVCTAANTWKRVALSTF